MHEFTFFTSNMWNCQPRVVIKNATRISYLTKITIFQIRAWRRKLDITKWLIFTCLVFKVCSNSITSTFTLCVYDILASTTYYWNKRMKIDYLKLDKILLYQQVTIILIVIPKVTSFANGTRLRTFSASSMTIPVHVPILCITSFWSICSWLNFVFPIMISIFSKFLSISSRTSALSPICNSFNIKWTWAIGSTLFS